MRSKRKTPESVDGFQYAMVSLVAILLTATFAFTYTPASATVELSKRQRSYNGCGGVRNPIVVEIRSDGMYEIDGRKILIGELESEIEFAMAQPAGEYRSVVLIPSRAARAGTLIRAIDIARSLDRTVSIAKVARRHRL